MQSDIRRRRPVIGEQHARECRRHAQFFTIA
jgi:hypothetical protein